MQTGDWSKLTEDTVVVATLGDITLRHDGTPLGPATSPSVEMVTTEFNELP